MNRKTLAFIAVLVGGVYYYDLVPTALAPTPTEQSGYPLTSACRVSVEVGKRGTYGGSGTLIATNGQKALVLTVKHVAIQKGNAAKCQWGDQTVSGVVLNVAPGADVALLLVDAPKGISPVPVALPAENADPIYLAGFPGYDRTHLRYQTGDFVELNSDTLTVTCRPEKGMSGGPAFDRYGRVVGTVSAYGTRYGFCGSGTEMLQFIQQNLK